MPDTYDLTTNIGKVRLKIADTDITNPIFSDAEIQSFIDSARTLLEAAAGALYAIAADRARLATKKTAGNYTEDLTQLADNLRKTAKEYLELARFDDGVVDGYSEMDWDGVGGMAQRQRIENELLRGER